MQQLTLEDLVKDLLQTDCTDATDLLYVESEYPENESKTVNRKTYEIDLCAYLDDDSEIPIENDLEATKKSECDSLERQHEMSINGSRQQSDTPSDTSTVKHIKEYTSNSIGKKNLQREKIEKDVYTCSKCIKTFQIQQEFQEHTCGPKIRTKDKKRKCANCSYQSDDLSNFKRHMLKHTGEYPFKCKLCHYGASVSSKVELHMMTHTGQRPFACTYCKYDTTTQSLLERHIKCKHIKNKQYTCDVCERKYANSTIYKKHKLTHSVEKPFTCNICAKGYVQSCYLKYHMLKHEDTDDKKEKVKASRKQKLHNCDVCGLLTTSYANLQQHKKFKHSLK